MNILKNQRLYNLKEDAYCNVVRVFKDNFKEVNDEIVNLRLEDNLNQVEIQTRTPAQLLEVLDKYSDFFEMIDLLN